MDWSKNLLQNSGKFMVRGKERKVRRLGKSD